MTKQLVIISVEPDASDWQAFLPNGDCVSAAECAVEHPQYYESAQEAAESAARLNSEVQRDLDADVRNYFNH
jgi:hypothetical protein